jgi:phosphate transport system protein
MKRHFEQELEGLRTSLIKMGSLVEEAVALSVRSLLQRDATLSQKVIEGDDRINTLEIEIDNAIVDLLALQQPVAMDLRLIVAAQKINNDLERIGDHAVNIAESVLTLLRTQTKEPLLEIPKMADVAQGMLASALDGFIHGDPQTASAVLTQDDVIDGLNRAMIQQVAQLIKTDQDALENGLEFIRISKNLERVADLATNIAEDVIFIAQARVLKHHAEEKHRHPR